MIDDQLNTTPIFMTLNTSEQRLAIGIQGAPHLKREEKQQYLGEFRERVIRILSKKQVAQAFIYPEITQALKHKQSSKLLINGELWDGLTNKYIALAKQVKKPYTMINDPELKGETGLVVVSDDAVDIEDIEVEMRESS